MASGSESESEVPMGKSLPGEAILQTLKTRMDEFCGIAKSVAEMNKTMKSLKEDVNILKRKRKVDDEQSSSSSKVRVYENTSQEKIYPSDSELESEEEQDDTQSVAANGKMTDDVDDIDLFLSDDKTGEEEDESFFKDLEEFYAEDAEVGQKIDDKLAGLTTSALQYQQREKEDQKLKEIKDRNKRPQNTPWLQVPQVDEFIWRRLHPKVKAADYLLQRSHGAMAATLVPLTKALGQVQNTDNKELKQHIGDAFKLLTNAMTKNTHTRRERIRKTVHPRYKNALNKHQHSAEKLFGEKLQEEAKSLVTDSRVNLMAHGGYGNNYNQQSFLEQRRGPRHQGPNRQNNQQRQSNYQKKFGHQNRGGKQKRFHKTN